MKKHLQQSSIMFLLVCIGAFLVVSPTASSQSLPAVVLQTSTLTPSIGQTFTVTIGLSNVQNLYGLEVTLSWDSSIIEATAIDVRLGVESFPDGVLHESSNSPPIFIAENNLTQNKGEYKLTVTSVGPTAPFTGSGNIVKIIFSPLNIGNSNLNLESELYDYPPTDRDPRISLAISHVNQDSSVTVTAPSPTDLSSNTPTPSTSATPSNTPSQTNTPITSGFPATTSTPQSSTSPATSDSPTPTTSEPPQWNQGMNLIAPVVLVLVLAIAFSAFLFFRRRKSLFQIV